LAGDIAMLLSSSEFPLPVGGVKWWLQVVVGGGGDATEVGGDGGG